MLYPQLFVSLLFIHLKLIYSEEIRRENKENISAILVVPLILKKRDIPDAINKSDFTSSVLENHNYVIRNNKTLKRPHLNDAEFGNLLGSNTVSRFVSDDEPQYYSFSKSLDDISRLWSNIHLPSSKYKSNSTDNIFLSSNGTGFNSYNIFNGDKSWDLKGTNLLSDPKNYINPLDTKVSEVEDESKANKILRFISSFGGVFGKEPNQDGLINYSSQGSYDELLPKSNINQEITKQLSEGSESQYYRGAERHQNRNIWPFENKETTYPPGTDYYLPHSCNMYDNPSGQTRVENVMPFSDKLYQQKDILKNEYQFTSATSPRPRNNFDFFDDFNKKLENETVNISKEKKKFNFKNDQILNSTSNYQSGTYNSTDFKEMNVTDNFPNDKNTGSFTNSQFFYDVNNKKDNYSEPKDDNVLNQTNPINYLAQPYQEVNPYQKQLNSLFKNRSLFYHGNVYDTKDTPQNIYNFSFIQSKGVNSGQKYNKENKSSLFDFYGGYNITNSERKKTGFGRTPHNTSSKSSAQKFEPIIVPEYEKMNSINLMPTPKNSSTFTSANLPPLNQQKKQEDKTQIDNTSKQFHGKFPVVNYLNYAGNSEYLKQGDKTNIDTENVGFLVIPLENYVDPLNTLIKGNNRFQPTMRSLRSLLNLDLIQNKKTTFNEGKDKFCNQIKRELNLNNNISQEAVEGPPLEHSETSTKSSSTTAFPPTDKWIMNSSEMPR